MATGDEGRVVPDTAAGDGGPVVPADGEAVPAAAGDPAADGAVSPAGGAAHEAGGAAHAAGGAAPGDGGAPEAAGEAQDGAGPGGRPAHLRRLPAARIRRRRRILLAGMGALTAVGVGLTLTGLSRVRSSTVGRYEEVVGADEPGHEAFIVPTPTMGVLHRDADGALVGAYVLALEPGDDGGAVIAVPPSTLVPGGEGTLADAYASGGAEAATLSLGQVLTAAVVDHVEVDDDLWAQLVEPVAPVEVTLDQPVGRWESGEVALDPADVGPFLAALGEGETDLARLERQQAFWSAWLPLVAAGGEDAVPGEASSGIGRFVRGIAEGETVLALPVGRDDDTGDRLVPDARLLGDLVAQAVPYPRSPGPGGRVRVRLLSGTGDPDEAAAAARALVAGGAEIVIVGNASSFDVAETTLVHRPGERDAALRLAMTAIDGRVEEAGGARDPATPGEEIDVTVILGEDAGDVMRR